MKSFLVFIGLFAGSMLFSQVGTITRHPDSYSDMAYEGVRIIQVDEAYAGDYKSDLKDEENIFIFSKIEKNANPDKMYFQRFARKDGKWKLIAKKEISHNGIISTWNARKAFGDYDKDRSVDALFIYSLNDANLKQQSVHLLFTKGKELYEVSTSADDGYTKDTYSSNFKTLPQSIQDKVLDYWNKLDKK